jgi:hypothetical protein
MAVPDHGTTYSKTALLPYRRYFDKPAAPNTITQLPLELQYLILHFLIGDEKGTVCCEELFSPNIPKNIPCYQEENGYYQSHTNTSLMTRYVYLKYRLPASASPQFMLASYGLYKLVHPLYHAICHAHVEAPWRDFH